SLENYKSVRKDLKDIQKPIIRLHSLRQDNLEMIIKTYAESNRPVPLHVSESVCVLNALEDGTDISRWKVITLLRDPVARNISAFFHNINIYIPDFKERLLAKTIDTESCIEYFRNGFGRAHDVPISWLDYELKSTLGIDLYETDFPVSGGYKIYKGEHPDLLLVKLEHLNLCVQSAFKDFMDIDGFELKKKNIGEEKEYSSLYKEFIDSIVLPESYLEKMYSSKYARHFYSDEELAGFRKRWKKS
ncbi:MAG: putative capsular polysaccharide synthesis family protein, partial [Thermodesulfobacteriota bacterium]